MTGKIGSHTEFWIANRRVYWGVLLTVLGFMGLYLTSLYSYLLFHGLVEIFSIVIGCGIFLVAWNAREFLRNNYLLFIGVAYFFVSGIDLIHMLTYKGMGVFLGFDADLPTQLWIAARYMQSVSLLIAPLFIERKLRVHVIFAVFSGAFTLLLISIFYRGVFPACYLEGSGLTTFKIVSEYMICLILLSALALLVVHRKKFDPQVLRLVLGSIIFTIGAELAFTLYISVFGLANLIGHYFKIISFYLMYRAIIETGLRQPYTLLFRELQSEKEALRQSEEEFRNANEQLRMEIDERRQLETLLRRERDTARMYLDVAGTIIVALDRDGNVTLINRKGSDVLGYQPETIVGRNWFDTFLPEWDRDRLKRAFSQVIARGIESAKYFENPVLTKSGEERLIAWYNTLLTDDAGQIQGTLSSGEDITERKRAEYALKESRERLDLALTGGDLGLWDWNVQTGKAVWNHRTFEMLGYATGEIESEISTWKRMIHPDDWPLVSSALNEHLESLSSSYEAEYRIQSKTGEWKWILSKGKVVEHDSNGKPLRIAGTILDITDRKRTDETLRVSEAQKQAILDGITSNIAFFNEDLEILWVNKTAANSVRKLPSQMIGQECHKFWADPGKPCDGCPAVTVFKTKKSEHATVVTPDGRIWDEKGEPIFDAHGRLMGVVEIAQDITDRVHAEKEKETLRSQLFQAQKMEAIGTLTGGIAHDFNNLLTIILGYSELLLQDRDEKDPAYADLQKIMQSARNGADMVQRLLVFSRKAETNPVPLDMNRQIRNAEQLLSRTLPKMIRIEMRLSDDLNLVHADAPQMEQIVMNLAINAKEAMPEGGILTLATSNVRLESEFCAHHPGIAPGDYVLLSVSDTGRGMDKETQDRMFDPFFTVKGWDSRKGTGLGLPVVLGIVQQHGGYIECLSEVGKGTTFNIYLPKFTADPLYDHADSRDVPALGTETILLVDDEDLVRQLGERILIKSGYRVLTARNGRQALDMYKQHQPDIALVILDLIMPEMSGKECLRELVKIDPLVRVIVSSGHSDSGDPDEVPREFVRASVKKPYGVGQLLGTIRKVLDAE